MTRRPLFLSLLLCLLFLTADASASLCDMQMTLNCASGQCTAVTTNIGTQACSATFLSAFWSSSPQVTLGRVNTSLGLGECFASGDFGVRGAPWSMCMGPASLAPGASFTATISASAEGLSTLPIIAATYVFNEGTGEEYGYVYVFNDAQLPTCTPVASVAAVTQSGLSYDLIWSDVSTPSSFEVEESTSADFSTNVTRQTVSGRRQTFRHDVTTTTIYYYRVRATSCNGSTGPYSAPVQVVVQALPATGTSGSGEVTVPVGSTAPASTRVFFRGFAEATTYTASADKPFLTVSPASGTIPPEGTTLTVTANPTGLPTGASTGTVRLSTTTHGTSSAPVSINLVTPVGPGSKNIPTGDTLIIPVVTHVNGGTGPFQSDVRLTNAGSSSMRYQLTLTPTRTDGTSSSKATEVTVEGGQTIALNDIVKNFFGFGATGAFEDVGFGALEIRPLNSSSNLTYAASRTFVTTGGGTLGQFIAAIPFSQFASNANLAPIPVGGGPGTSGPPVLSLQQVAQSARFRTNLGLVEGSGTPASGRIRVLDTAGNVLKVTSYTLQPGEHQQHNQFISATAGIANLEDGRIEITVDSPTGAVTAYASVLDQKTTDPLAVQPVQASKVRATRYVVPGVAELNNGPANFHSDVRLFNGGVSPVTATLTYYPQGAPAAASVASPVTIAPGEVRAFDNLLPSVFGVNSGGGSLLVTTPNDSSLVVTGRTYSIGANQGTYGLFVPGITPQEARGVGERALQILQLEQSPKFRSNLGLAEVSGNPAKIRITLSIPDSKVSPVVERDLQANEFIQLGQVINSFLPGEATYNARIYVEVIGGTGRVTAYGSVVDNFTQDPTYVPAQ